MPALAALAAALALLTGACAGSESQQTPEDATRTFIAAANRNDVSGMRAVAISPDRLRRALSCPPDDTNIDIIEAVAGVRETMAERAGSRVVLKSVDEVSKRSVAIGDDYRGCRASEPFELRRLRMAIAIHDGDAAPREKTEEGDAIRLDGRWYLVIPSP